MKIIGGDTNRQEFIMAMTTEVSITMTPEARGWVEALGLERELETMLDHTRQTVPRLHSIEVTRYDDPDDPNTPRVIITAWQNGPSPAGASDGSQWVRWMI